MPLLTVTTNLALDTDRQAGLLAMASSLVANALGKPERYVMIALDTDRHMMFAGSNEPCAYIELKSLGLPEAQTASFSKSLCEFLHEQTGIRQDRIYIEFAGPERHMWGWNSGTF